MDVAQRVVIGDEDVWFIPTSGHRAYPYKYRGLHHSFDLERSVPRSEEWDALPRPLFQHATRGEHGSAACKVAGGVGVASEASYQQGNRSLVRWEGAPMSVEEALEKEAAIEKEVMKRWKALGAIISWSLSSSATLSCTHKVELEAPWSAR